MIGGVVLLEGIVFLLNVPPCFHSIFMSWELIPVAEFTYSKSSPREWKFIRDPVKRHGGLWDPDSTFGVYEWSSSEHQWVRIRVQQSPERSGHPLFGTSRHTGN